ncbi:MAG TPA: hypothetical protein VM577_21265 [Anaerovoracaceae bacterium]|nr:hypothetical protein [Anaerovoracaceae bacterium]
MLNQIVAAGIVIFSVIMAADGRGKTPELRGWQILGGILIAAVVLW